MCILQEAWVRIRLGIENEKTVGLVSGVTSYLDSTRYDGKVTDLFMSTLTSSANLFSFMKIIVLFQKLSPLFSNRSLFLVHKNHNEKLVS